MLNRREIAELLASSVARQRPQDKCGAAAPPRGRGRHFDSRHKKSGAYGERQRHTPSGSQTRTYQSRDDFLNDHLERRFY